MDRLPIFAERLSTAVHLAAVHQGRSIESIQNDLGHAVGRKGRAAIDYWRRGFPPSSPLVLERLAFELAKLEGLPDRAEIEKLLHSGGHPDPREAAYRLWSTLSSPAAAAGQARPSDSRARDRSPAALAPFVTGVPITHPRQFFGRELELRRIFHLWGHFPLQNVAILGLRRSGKTSLLRYLQAIACSPPDQLRPRQRGVSWLPHAERYRWVFVDFQHPRLCSQEGLLGYLLSELQLPIPNLCDLGAFMDVVSRGLQAPTLVLMDEIEAALASPDLHERFWSGLRSLASNHTNGNLGFVLTAQAAPASLAYERGKPSPFFNIFGHTLQLGPLLESEARELIASSPRPFDDADREWILEHSGQWPALLQILCQVRLMAMESGETGTWQQEGLRQIAPYRYLVAEP